MPFISSVRGTFNNPKKESEGSSILDKFEITGGDTVYTAGGYRIHMFTTVGESALHVRAKPGAFKDGMMNLLAPVVTGTEFLIVGGGASGGSRHSGGGGAGGMVVSTAYALPTGALPVVVGAGGSTNTGDNVGPSGGQSSFNGAVAQGGGGGGTWGAGDSGNAGGSGGGASGVNGAGGRSGQQPGQTPMNGLGYGYPGGNCYYDGPALGGGGGGGAGGSGAPGAAARAGTGGPGRINTILGTSYYWAGGGGGGTWNGTAGGYGGTGGGGGGAGGAPGGGGTGGLNNGATPGPYGATATDTVGGNAGANTGSGGGGANQSPSTGGAGGSGIVVVRYPIS